MAQSHVLFFSNFCNYSKEIVGIITRKNIRNAFVFVCVDNVRPIPPFVDRVPMITSIANKSIYMDDELPDLLDRITNAMFPPTQIEAVQSLSAFNGADNIDSEFEAFGQDQTNFSMIDMDNYRITTLKEDDDIKAKKGDSSHLEQYKAQRDNDIKITASDRPNFR